nr:MAG TPA_asm: hypothetical protein [Caudoviricetes sp.]
MIILPKTHRIVFLAVYAFVQRHPNSMPASNIRKY